MSTNHEPKSSKETFVDYFERYDLPYENTEWARFYANYTEKNNLQIQKYLLKVYNEFTKIAIIEHSAYRKMAKLRLVKRWFRNTDIDKYGKPCTPQRLLGEFGCLNNDIVFSFLKKRVTREYKEIKSFYNNRKIELNGQNKAHRRERAKQKVECPICKTKVTRTNLSQHKKFNKYCQSIANNHEP